MTGFTFHSQSCSSSPSPPSPLTPQRPLTPPPRRPRTPVTPAPSSPRVNTVPLPALSPGAGPVPITITGPSTPIAGVFGMMGLNLEPSNWSIGSPAALPPGHGLGGHAGASLPNSAGGSGTGTPTRSFHHHPQAISPAGLMALHNSFDRYERDLERRWVVNTATSTPAASTPPSPHDCPGDLPSVQVFSSPPDESDVEEQTTPVERPQGPASEEEIRHDNNPQSADDGPGSASPLTSPPSQTQSSLALQMHSRPTLEPLILPSSTLLTFPLATPQVLTLDQVRLRRVEGVLAHWPAVTRVAGHTVIHRAVPGKIAEYSSLDIEEGDVLHINHEQSGGALEPADSSMSSTSPVSEPSLSLARSPSPPVPSTRAQASVSLVRPASPAIFGPDLAGPLVARIARSKAAGTPEAWWAWGAPAIRAAAWGVLEDEPPVEAVTAADPHSHASTTTETVTTTTTETRVVETADETLTTRSTMTETTTTTAVTSCACNNNPLSWAEGGGFTTRLGTFLFAPPFEEHEAAEMRVSAASAAALLTVCDGTCGCESAVVESCEIRELDEGQVVDVPHEAEDEATPTEKTPTERTQGQVAGHVTGQPILKSQSQGQQQQAPDEPSDTLEDATKNDTGLNTEPDAEPNSGLLGLSLSFTRAPIRLSEQFGTDKEKEKEHSSVSTAANPTTPPTAPVALPEPISPRSRGLAGVLGLSPKKRK